MTDMTLNLSLLKGLEAVIGIGGYSIEGGRPVTGVPPTENDITGGGFWKVKYSSIVIGSPEQHQEWFKLMAHLARAGNRLIVQLLTDIISPPSMNAEIEGTPVEHAGTIDIKVNAGTLVAGTVFSINHATKAHRAYIVSSIDAIATGVYTVGIVPTLREATADAVACDFRTPKVMMRKSPGFTLDWLPYGKFTADQTLDLVEAGW